jgi:hypothetical protein
LPTHGTNARAACENSGLVDPVFPMTPLQKPALQMMA